MVSELDSDDPFAHVPWVSGAAELLAHALEHYQRRRSSDLRIALILTDNAVELMLKIFLDSVQAGDLKLSKSKLRQTSFSDLFNHLQTGPAAYLEGISIPAVLFFHGLRNDLYHRGAGQGADDNHVRRYLTAARKLFRNLFGLEAPTSPPGESAPAGSTEVGAWKLQDGAKELLDRLGIALQATTPEDPVGRAELRRLRMIFDTLGDNPDADLASDRLIREVEEYLASITPRAAITGDADVAQALLFVERELDSLLDQLTGPITKLERESLHSRIALAAPVLTRKLQEALLDIAMMRNAFAHGSASVLPDNAPDLMLETAVELEVLRHQLTDADVREWRRKRGLPL